jgi:hypothetical protein
MKHNNDVNCSSEKYELKKEDVNCAPHIEFDGISCIKLSILIEMAKAYNKHMGKDIININVNRETLNPIKYKNDLIKQFNKHMGDTCSTQECWTKQDFIKHLNKHTHKEVIKYTFRPKGPEGTFEWLNTYNINDVMHQYEKKYTDFKYLGTVPMDFDSLPQLGINDINIEQLYKNGIKQIGMVINLDESGQPGSHWVGLYAHFNKGVYYFDSYGIRPEPRVRTFMRRIFKQAKQLDINKNIKLEADYNKKRHQFKNSECGVYSMNFIIRMLNNESFDNICFKPISDDDINKCRKKYFIN